MVQFKARMGEVSESVGAAMLPILNKLADVLLEYVAPAIEVAAKWLGDNLPAAIAVVSDWLNRIMAVFQSTGDSSGELSDVLSFLGEVWGLLSDVIKLEVNVILAIVIPAFEMIAGFINDHGEEIKTVLSAAWTIIKTVITTALAVIKGVLTAAMQLIKGDWSGAWETIKGVFATVWAGIKTIVDANLTVIKTLLSLAWDSVKGTVANAWDGIKSAVANAWDGIKGAISSKIGELKDILQRLPSQVVGIGESIINTIWDGVRRQWDAFIRWLNEKLASAREVWNSITGGGGGGDTPGNAVGTKNWRGGMTMVGEFGPELVSLPRGSQIHTASDTRSILQQGQMNVNVSFDGRGADLLRQMIRVEVDTAMNQSGNQAFNRMRTRG
jgi:phage-related protein